MVLVILNTSVFKISKSKFITTFRTPVNYPLSANFTKWSNTLKQFFGKLLANCLSVFDHFVGLALKGLTVHINMSKNDSRYRICVTWLFPTPQDILVDDFSAVYVRTKINRWKCLLNSFQYHLFSLTLFVSNIACLCTPENIRKVRGFPIVSGIIGM